MKEIICPCCNKEIQTSNYLNTTFRYNYEARTCANLITHYRHEHIIYYNLITKILSFGGELNKPYLLFKAYSNRKARERLTKLLLKKDEINLINGFKSLGMNY